MQEEGAIKEMAMEEEQVQESQAVEGEGYQKDGKRKEERWNTKKNRGPNRQTITLGGLHKVQKAKKRKEKQKLRRKLGEMEIPVHGGWKRQTGPLPPTRSVIFLDNTAGGLLAKRFQEAESAGTPLSMLLPSTNPWGPQDCTRLDCVTCNQGDEKRINCRKRNVLYESECILCMESQ